MVRELFTRLRKPKKEEVPAAEPRKRFRRWLSHGRAIEAAEEKLRRNVTSTKIDPWFSAVFSPHTEEATALYSFSSQSDHEVSFKKGDTLIVEFDQNEEWLEATNVETKKKGFIPANYITLERNIANVVDAWQDITRLEAEWKLLMSGLSHGTFILRPSSYASKSALSVLFTAGGSRRVKHYRITRDAGTDGFKISSSKSFPTLYQLVRYYKEKVSGHHRLLSHPLPKAPTPALQSREFTIDRNQVELGKRIHRGSFGQTYLATYRSCEVIAKRASSSKSRGDLLEIGKSLHRLSHPRLLRLLGVCGDKSDGQPILFITEYAPRGSLQDFLRSEEGRELDFDRLLGFLLQSAEAMDYLENVKSFHGDLRAANVFLATDFTVKVGNFGLSKILNDTEAHKQSRQYTLRWAAPETVKPGYSCSIKADVWSFGVLAFEVLTFASEPYADIELNEVIERVSTGYRLPNPSKLGFTCEKAAYNLMLDCWAGEPESRPTFRDVCFLLKDMFSGDEDIYASID
nr:unnamed protein product [Spirometra erinaceieuropaei]